MRRIEVAAYGVAVVLASLAGCNDNPSQLIGGGQLYGEGGCVQAGDAGGDEPSGSGGDDGGGAGNEGGEAPHEALSSRVVDYGEALRSARFKLLGNAPNADEIFDMQEAIEEDADGGKAHYEEAIEAMLDDGRFKVMMIDYWRDIFHIGDEGTPNSELNRAAYFAAKLTTTGDDLTKLFTADSATCPTFDSESMEFSDDVDSSCSNVGSLAAQGLKPVGVLSDPGLQSAYYGNLAFLRVRFFNEAFNCQEQPIEYADEESYVDLDGKTYTGPWTRESVGAPENCGTDGGCAESEQGRINFLDYSGVVCANCHGSSNHRAPLFAKFDENGQYQADIAVGVPIDGNPAAELRDWLSPGYRQTAYKFGQEVNSLAEFGAALKADDDIIACLTMRGWNFAFSKGDAVGDLADVPPSVLDPVIEHFVQSGYDFRSTLKFVFTHDDFVRY